MRANINGFATVATTLLVLSGSGALQASAQSGKLTIHADKPGIKISPILNGLMIEEINHSLDGGLYGELIQNRAFKNDATQPVHWSLLQDGGGTGSFVLDSSQPVSSALAKSLKLTVTSAGSGKGVGVSNEGYWGIPAKPNTKYRASFYAKGGDGFKGPLQVAIETADGSSVVAQAQVSGINGEWRKYTVTLSTRNVAASTTNRFVIRTKSTGTVWFSLVSLFPQTYHKRSNGNRVDLMEKLKDLKPAFLRLPGGNYLEGDTIEDRFAWKETVGDLSQRPGHQAPWGYRSTDGLGLLEFLEWCEDLKMQPLLAVYAGYSLRGAYVEPGPKLEPFVQEAMDEIEYVTGDKSTKWGAVRAKDGHPEPFKVDYIEIGNEDWFDRSGSYEGRFVQFADAIKAKYPKLKLIATMPVKTPKADVFDDHYYRTARDMAQDAGHYDSYDRNGPKIFVGEWASTEGSPTPTHQAALGDAAWLLGLERNSDVVVMQSYAPLLVNVNPGARQWGTNLIGYDALSSYGSPSYYVQTMFGANMGDRLLPVDLTPQPLAKNGADEPTPKGKIGVGTWATQAEYKDIKVTGDGGTALYSSDFASRAGDWTPMGGNWEVADGVLKQTGRRENTRTTVGDVNWTDYTYTSKARKTGGAEGFLFLFHVQDENNYIWWNVGGWGNTQTALEKGMNGGKSMLGKPVPMSLETGRWYDVRIEVKGKTIRCYLDDKLVTEAIDTQEITTPLHADASRDLATGDIILKVVNVSQHSQTLDVNVEGVKSLAASATGQILSGLPSDVNSVASPMKVAPKQFVISNVGKTFTHEFPPYSFSIIRLKAK